MRRFITCLHTYTIASRHSRHSLTQVTSRHSLTHATSLTSRYSLTRFTRSLASSRFCICCYLQGLIFAAATDDGEVKLYDARGYDKGPFTTFQIGTADSATGLKPRVTCAKFSSDGEGLLLVAGLYTLNPVAP